MEQFEEQKSGQGFGDYWAIVLRRKWWILGPLFFGWLIVFASAWFLPPRYVSESTILVEPPKVPSKLVEPNVQVDLADRVQSMSYPGAEPYTHAGSYQPFPPVSDLRFLAG